MRSALTILGLGFVALSFGWAATASAVAEAEISAWAIEPSEPGTTVLDVAEAAKLAAPLARRWEASEHVVDVAGTRNDDDCVLTQNDVRSKELFRRPALASAMSLVEQSSMLENGAGTWVLDIQARPNAELRRVLGRQADP